MDAVAAKMEEYKAVRAEILVAINSQHASLRFGSAVVLALFVFAVRDRGPMDGGEFTTCFTYFVLLLAIPIICYVTIMIWLGEVWRMMRAGEYLELLEREINYQHFGEERVLNWENWRRSLRSQKVHVFLRGNYWGTLVLFFGGSVFSIVMGTYLLSAADRPVLAVTAGIVNVVLLVVVIMLTHAALRRFR